MNDVINIVLKVFVVALIAVVAKFVIPVFTAYVEKHKDSQIYSLIETAVRAAEQTIKESGAGEIKKEQVVEFVIKWLNEKNIDLDYDQLDKMIEECVYLLKNS